MASPTLQADGENDGWRGLQIRPGKLMSGGERQGARFGVKAGHPGYRIFNIVSSLRRG